MHWTGKFAVVVFRNQSGAKEATVLVPTPLDARYEARSVMSGRALGTVTAEMLRFGWSVPLTGSSRVEVIALDR